MFGQVWVEETRSIILWFGLNCSVSLTPWTMTFTSTHSAFFLLFCEGACLGGLKFGNFPLPQVQEGSGEVFSLAG